MLRRAALGVLASLVAACTSAAQPDAARTPAPSAAQGFDVALWPQFWPHWGDGQAELSGYVLERERYGEKRTGTLVSIFVTEPFSVADNVKAEKPRPPSDVVQVLKHNLVEKFQTGVYDYQIFTSTFVVTAPVAGRGAGQTTKVSSSTQEWCGTTYHEVSFDARGGVEVLRSYFDGESRTGPLPSVPALVEDAAWHWARGLAAPFVPAGESTAVTVLPSLATARLKHQALSMARATLSRGSATEEIEVPAGRLVVRRASVAIEGHATTTFFVEDAVPHRVVRVERSDGLVASLTGSVRSPYWQKNHEGDEALLGALGLVPPRARPMSAPAAP